MVPVVFCRRLGTIIRYEAGQTSPMPWSMAAAAEATTASGRSDEVRSGANAPGFVDSHDARIVSRGFDGAATSR